ncbi:S41 family peptidase [Nonlabens ulvanivorans]|uniref:S41 family peptidase n=1 Tax=Nonlabens ulvanivorans TaxID=906888 RepID=UPI0037C9300A
MMKSYKNIILLCLTVLMTVSCFKDNDDNFASSTSIKNFVYRGMNAFYLYKPDVPELADDRFATVPELEEFHSIYDTPEAFFESLVFDRSLTDRFSVIVSDYIALEQLFAGTTLNNGMEFGLVGETGSASNVWGYVRYVLPNSSASTQGVARGMIFNQIDGIQLTRDNFSVLLGQDSYTIGLADLNAGVATSNGMTITLDKTSITENPVFRTAIIDQGSQKIGYLMYNSFTSNFDEQLNDAFGTLQAAGVTHLVLDLRYNGGGSVNTSIILGSLIAGQPTTDVFSTEEWNPDVQEFFENNQPDRLTNFFKTTTNAGTALNTLGLSKVHIITTGSSASASELVIAALEPYVDVIQVGDDTAGKFQASITLYDSSDFGRSGANPAHRYALQPLVLKSINSAGFTDYFNGLVPDIALREDFENLGVLGDVNEPLLAACLQDIMANGRPSFNKSSIQYDELSGSMELKPFSQEMWKEAELNEYLLTK